MNGWRGCVYTFVCANNRFGGCNGVELLNRSAEVQKGFYGKTSTFLKHHLNWLISYL